MCSPNNSANAAAQQQVQTQQQGITNNVAAINQAFSGRQQQYTNYLNALNTSYQQQLGVQQASAGRGLKFALARGGMTGSSVAADQGGLLQQEMGQGTITAAQQAQAKLAGLQSSDQAAKNQMISLAQAGNMTGAPAQQSATALNANLNNAQANLGPDTLGNVFGGVTNSVQNMQAQQQQRLGLNASSMYAYGGAGTGAKGLG